MSELYPEHLGEQPPELPASVFDFYAMAKEARERQIEEWETLSDEEKAEAIRQSEAMMGH